MIESGHPFEFSDSWRFGALPQSSFVTEHRAKLEQIYREAMQHCSVRTDGGLDIVTNHTLPNHVSFVMRGQAYLLKQLGYDPEVIEEAVIGAALHDIGMRDGRKGHEKKGAQRFATPEYFPQLGDKENTWRLQQMIAGHNGDWYKVHVGDNLPFLQGVACLRELLAGNPGAMSLPIADIAHVGRDRIDWVGFRRWIFDRFPHQVLNAFHELDSFGYSPDGEAFGMGFVYNPYMLENGNWGTEMTVIDPETGTGYLYAPSYLQNNRGLPDAPQIRRQFQELFGGRVIRRANQYALALNPNVKDFHFWIRDLECPERSLSISFSPETADKVIASFEIQTARSHG